MQESCSEDKIQQQEAIIKQQEAEINELKKELVESQVQNKQLINEHIQQGKQIEQLLNERIQQDERIEQLIDERIQKNERIEQLIDERIQQEERLHIIQKVRSIVCTCGIGIIALIAATYLLLGNFLFKFIIPFCKLAKYIFIGSISLVSLFSAVITIIRFCNIHCYSDIETGEKNPNYFSSIFFPYMSLEPDISTPQGREAIEQT